VPADDIGYSERPFDYPGVDNNGDEKEYDMGAYEALMYRFTVTADCRDGDDWPDVLQAISDEVGNEGVFHISPGDIDPVQNVWNELTSEFGSDVIWYPVVGNHEAETESDMEWIRGDLDDADDYGHYGDKLLELRFPDPRIVKAGPTKGVGTIYSFEYQNAHFIVLNEYYDGKRDDSEEDGQIHDPMYNWLVDDLSANRKPLVFVFGHEPAYPKHRHERDPEEPNWPQFWELLNDRKVATYFCGHTHYYSRCKVGGGGLGWEPFTWQADAGNAGQNSHGYTFLDVTVTDKDVQFDAWRKDDPDSSDDFEIEDSWTLLDLAVPVRISEDDAQENGSVDVDNLALELGETPAGQQMVGLRFQEVSIPKDATIESAYIQFTAYGESTGSCSLTIRGEKDPDASPFDEDDISERDLTDEEVDWATGTGNDLPYWSEPEQAGKNERTPNIGPIIQEIVGQSGWSSGNALAIIITSESGSFRRAFACDAYNRGGGGGDNYAPVLFVKVSR
jgi:hypothetical protein